jgi:AraC-like DNA-binding protein
MPSTDTYRVLDVTLVMHRLHAGRSIAPHRHAFHELIYVLNGVYTAQLGEWREVGHAGDAFIYPDGVGHDSRGTQDGKTRLLVLQWHLVPASAPCISFARLRDVGGRLLYPLMRMLDLTPAQTDPDLALRESLLAVVEGECRALAETASPTIDPITRVRRTLDGLTGIPSSVPIEELAALAGMTPAHFSRCFRARTGDTPVRYLQRKRVQDALPLILHADLPFAEIARRVGLCDASHLCRLVVREYGRPPRDLREEAQGRRRSAPRRAQP